MTSRVITIVALMLFVAMTIWINYEIKVKVQQGGGQGSSTWAARR
jgi:hypothetical protein